MTPTMHNVVIIRVTVIHQVEKCILPSYQKKLPRPETNTLDCTVRTTPESSIEKFSIDVLNMFLLSSDSFMIWAGQRPSEILYSSETLPLLQETSEGGPSNKHQNENDENEEESSKD
ncbi:hypothetical protein AVEN_215672-1 [Araneus ventricosus]|uniref:Uncharacterized protein n=1 Tax=Araneus ventricosus TaxID=182803 RepID=A0A4Y2VMN7_ARAVE|nr:hypothetical protein AVEN_215672-1 [Araneus ventricosus]